MLFLYAIANTLCKNFGSFSSLTEKLATLENYTVYMWKTDFSNP